jgi:hypothetical protein
MNIQKNTFNILLLFTLSNCVPTGTAFLGPGITVAKTGNIYQAGLSYSSNMVVSKLTGKSTSENIKSLFDDNINEEEKNYKSTSENTKLLFASNASEDKKKEKNLKLEKNDSEDFINAVKNLLK